MKNTVLLICAVLTVNTVAAVCPAWNENSVYNQGDDVCYNNQAYEVAPNVYNISGYDYRPDGPYAHFWQATDDCDCEEPQQTPWLPSTNGIYYTGGNVGIGREPDSDYELDVAGDAKIEDVLYTEIIRATNTISVWVQGTSRFAHMDTNEIYIQNGMARKTRIKADQTEIYEAGKGTTYLRAGDITTPELNAGVVNTDEIKVNGELFAKQVTVTLDAFPDYVFSPSHKLKSLSEIEEYIEKYGMLPGMPSESEVKAEGVELGELNVKLLEKIEEMTLHLINLEKKNNALEARIKEIEKKK